MVCCVCEFQNFERNRRQDFSFEKQKKERVGSPLKKGYFSPSLFKSGSMLGLRPIKSMNICMAGFEPPLERMVCTYLSATFLFITPSFWNLEKASASSISAHLQPQQPAAYPPANMWLKEVLIQASSTMGIVSNLAKTCCSALRTSSMVLMSAVWVGFHFQMICLDTMLPNQPQAIAVVLQAYNCI